MQRVLDEATAKRTSKQLAADEYRDRIYSIPEISAAQKAYTTAKFNALFKTGKAEGAEVTSTKAAYVSALEKHGVNENDFIAKPDCTLCNDTGIYDDKACACVRKAFIEELKKECELDKRAPFAFSDFNPIYATDEQKSALSKLYKVMETYVDKYPNVKYPLILFLGTTGTGKSCLASAMVRKSVLSYGRSALKMSAYELNNVFLTAHTSFLSEKQRILHDVMTVDMLVIDDLGTEPMLKNVTVEYLQLLLEERTQAKKTTVITTNMNEKQLLKCYGERIFSRISDKNTTLAKQLTGNDMRHKNL